MPTEPAVVVDGGDQGCGELLLELHRRVRGLGEGTHVRLVSTDPGAVHDLPAWCHLTGHHYLGRTRSADDRPAYDFAIAPRSSP